VKTAHDEAVPLEKAPDLAPGEGELIELAARGP
jgi:hypothetical protein